MTHLPLESRDVWGQPGPEYKPQDICAHPFCEEINPEPHRGYHHLWPRSFLRNQPQNWVKLPDGRVVGNLVYLCREHHRQITDNEAKIEWANHRFDWSDLKLLEQKDENSYVWYPLNPQPPLSQKEVMGDTEGAKTPRRLSEGLTAPPEGWYEELLDKQFPPTPAPGEDCKLCKRRVPHPKKESSPQTSVVKSWRMPAEEKENREETIAATAEHLGISQKEKFWMDKLILTLCVLALQGPGHD